MRVRDYAAADLDAVVALSLRAWEPVFASVEAVLGRELNALLHGEDWRPYQARAVEEALGEAAHARWVAEQDDGAGRVAGFAVARVFDADRRIGELLMIAVDPAHQRRGVGRALTEHATAWMRDAGMRVAALGTGGDPGHAPARALYERAGYRPLPGVQYFRSL
jgi:ribosomal protein S18 acetylase RimI-like enzyme